MFLRLIWLPPLIPLLQAPLKLSEDDVWIVFTGAVIPGAAAIASVAVAAVSAWIALRAYKMARGSEEAREAAESHRLDVEHQLRFDVSLKSLYLGIAQRVVALRDYDATVRTNAFQYGHNLAGVKLPPKPDDSSLLASISAAQLDSSDEPTTHMLNVVASYASRVADQGNPPFEDETREERERRVESEIDAWKHLLAILPVWREANAPDRHEILRQLS